MKKSRTNSWLLFALFFLLGITMTSLIFSALLIYNGREKYNTPPVIKENQQTKIEIAGTQPEKEVTLPKAAPDGVISKTVPIVAVSMSQDMGVMGNLTVKLIPGSTDVLVKTNPFLEPDLQYSANTAVSVAKQKTGITAPDKDVVLIYNSPARVIGGGSAGAATTIAVMAALENKTIREKIAMTGTIQSDGTIGQIGGVFEKAKAVADDGYELFLVPKGQSTARYYERVVEKKEIAPGFVVYNTRYLPKVIDLKQEAKKEWGLEVVEVSNIDEAAKLMISE